jgi:1-phosphofructokinase
VILTLTLNPSLDRTLEVPTLERGGVLRTSEPTLEPGGKGVNVTRALVANGVPSVAILPIGGTEGSELGRLLAEDGVETSFVPISSRTRSNNTLSESDGTVTKLNEPGAALSDRDLTALVNLVRSTVRSGDWVVVSGSVPPAFDAAHLARIAESVADAGAHLAVDTSGEALLAAVATKPRLVKPNRDELCDLVGHPVNSIAEVISAAELVRERGVDYVLVSLGADGAVLVCKDRVIVGESTVVTVRSTVGAGDCFLAGFLSRFATDETDLETAVLEGLAWGAAAASLPGTAVPGPADIRRSDVQLAWQPDLDRPLVAT